MPIIRNPFSRRNDEAIRAAGSEKSNGAPVAPPGHIDIKEPTEYKLSGECQESGRNRGGIKLTCDRNQRQRSLPSRMCSRIIMMMMMNAMILIFVSPAIPYRAQELLVDQIKHVI